MFAPNLCGARARYAGPSPGPTHFLCERAECGWRWANAIALASAASCASVAVINTSRSCCAVLPYHVTRLSSGKLKFIVQPRVDFVELCVRGRRSRRRAEVVRIELVKDCTHSVSKDPSGRPFLMLHVEVFSSGPSGTYNVNFRLAQGTKVELEYSGSTISPYHIKWTMGRMHYTLKVCRLSLVSNLMDLNWMFDVRHIRK